MTSNDLITLLPALEARGPQAALVHYSPQGRTELSGHVLANWIIKSVNLLRDEVLIDPGDLVILDLPPHWKRTVLHLSALLAGADVRMVGESGPGSDAAPRVVATNSPGSDIASEADEVLALDPVDLALAFTGDLPALAIDWVQAVRSHPDALSSPISPATEWNAATTPTGAVEPGSRRLLASLEGQDLATAVGLWAAGATVIAPASALDSAALSSEGVKEADLT